jgi:hypothetical protein
MEKRFVEFFSPGAFVYEKREREIDAWDVPKAIEMYKGIVERGGPRSYGFRFITKTRGDADLDSKQSAASGMYYINGAVRTLGEIKAENNPKNEILICNMENNGYDRVVTTGSPIRWTAPFMEGDEIVRV